MTSPVNTKIFVEAFIIVLIVVGCAAGIVAAGALIYLAFFLPFTVRSMRLLPSPASKTVDGVTTIEEAEVACRASGLAGRTLVAYAQKLTARRFEYSRRNPWDTWEAAFARGMGYCVQQAMALHRLYERLGIESWPVQSLRVRFPGHVVHGVSEPPGISGHMWLRVKVDGEVFDVCPGNPSNVPGVTHFQPLTRVMRVRLWAVPILLVLSAAENVRRDWKNLW